MARERDIDKEMQNLDHLIIPTQFKHASIDLGMALNGFEHVLPIVNVSIPFGGDYLLLGGLGAGTDPEEGIALSLFSVGLGYKNNFPNNELFHYLLSAQVKTYQTAYYKNTSLTGEFDLEQPIDDNINLSFGVLIGIQHYITNEKSVYGSLDDRTFSSLLKASLKTPYVNFQVKGSLNMISMGASFTLKLDE
jgi:hypothetical protein